MLLTYPGPHAHVDVAAIPTRVERGGTLEVDGELADQLIEQGWLTESDRPDGTTIDAVLAWVAGDPVRAASQIEAETARSKPRQKLIDQLSELLTTSEED